MELIGGLSMMGHILSNKSNNSPIANSILTENQNNKPRKYANYAPEKKITNIYSDNNKKRVQHIMNDTARKRVSASRKPEKTGIIPKFFNRRKKNNKVSFDPNLSDSEFSDMSDMSETFTGSTKKNINIEDPRAFVKAQDNFTNTSAHEQKFLEKTSREKNMFLNQFEDLRFDNPGAPSAANGVPQMTGENGSTKRMELERNLALNEGFSNFDNENDMTYNVVNKDQFVHNNMKPYFKGKSFGFNQEHENKLNSIKQRTLEQFTGSVDNLEWRPKTERKPLFDPTVGMTNIYGTPVMIDYYESRYIPSDQRRNEKPFQEVRITPGLGLGYNEVGKQGYHDTYRVLPKTVDELRTINNPKLSYEGVVIEGMKGERGPIASKVFRRRPLTFKEYSEKDMLPSLGYLLAPTVYGNIDPANLSSVNRGSMGTEYYGGAGFYNDQAKPESMIEKTKESTKENYLYDDPRNVQKLEGKDARGHDDSYDPKLTQRDKEQSYIGPAKVARADRSYAYNQQDNIPDMNLRDIHNRTDRAGNIGSSDMQKEYTYDYVYNIPDSTMRNIHEKTDRVGQVNNPEMSGKYAFDPINNTQDLTMRNIHDKTDRAGQTNNSEMNKSYAFDKLNNIQDLTMRDIHSKTDRAGQANNPEIDKSYAFDSLNNIQDLTMRDIHSKTKRAGQMGTDEMNGKYAFDYVTNIPDPNMRNVHEKRDRVGQMGNNEIGKVIAFDYVSNIQDPTMRDIHGKRDRGGNFSNPEINKRFAFNYESNIQDPTMRDIHSKKDRAGNMGNAELDKRFAFDYVSNIQDPTMRDIHNKNRPGIANAQEWERQRSRGDANNERINTTKEKIAKGRAPTTSNYDKGPTPELTMFRFCEPIQIIRDLYPDNQGKVTSTKLGTVYTRDKESLPQQSWHFYSYVDDNLKNNPYVNNIVHQAPAY
jgi:hypothetical protein